LAVRIGLSLPGICMTRSEARLYLAPQQRRPTDNFYCFTRRIRVI